MHAPWICGGPKFLHIFCMAPLFCKEGQPALEQVRKEIFAQLSSARKASRPSSKEGDDSSSPLVPKFSGEQGRGQACDVVVHGRGKRAGDINGAAAINVAHKTKRHN